MSPVPAEPSAVRYGFVPRLASLLVRLLSRTWRIELVEGEEVFDRLLAERRPAVWCLWHNRIVAGTGLLIRRIAPAGADLTLLTSASRDGDIAAAVIAGQGLGVVRGSSSRRGARALRELMRAVHARGTSPIMVPDGPRGPVYRMKEGTLATAAATGLPVFCLGLAARRAWVLGSWDRLIVPKPFARIAVAVAEPIPVPRRPTAEEAGALVGRIERTLHRLDRTAEAAVGTTDPWATDELTAEG